MLKDEMIEIACECGIKYKIRKKSAERFNVSIPKLALPKYKIFMCDKCIKKWKGKGK